MPDPRLDRRLDRRRPFTRATALAAGLTPRELTGPDFRRLHHGVYAARQLLLTPTVWVEAALLLHPPSAYASHSSAALVLGLPVPRSSWVHVSVARREDRRRPRTFRHHLAPADARTVTVDGLRVSAPEQLFCELAEELGLVDLVVAGDALVRRHGTTPARLRVAAERSRRVNRALAVRAAALVRADVDSPMESRLRLLLVLAGLPEPEVNVTVQDADGRPRYRLDLAYRRWRVAVEYDGRQHRADLDQWDHDLTRRDWLDEHGWQLVPVVARGIYRRPDETLERVRAALVRAGATGLPRFFEAEWRQHFDVAA